MVRYAPLHPGSDRAVKTLGVRATPGFFVNGRPLTDFGAVQLRALVDEELAKVRKP